MILLSNVIKPHRYITLEDKKVIESAVLARNISNPYAEDPSLLDERIQEMEAILAAKEEIIRDAEQFAEQQLLQCQQEIELLKEQAQREIDAWWEQKRLQDAQLEDEARRNGFEDGFHRGTAEADVAVRQHYAEQLEESRTILEQSYQLKDRIIQEAEPFLVELSGAIAEKIINRQLALNPEWVIEMTRSILGRRRDKGIVTLCVSPKQFPYLQEARDELLLVIDSQAELQILPDATIADHGCVVRTAFGSIDARIDTQLKEIKGALQQLALSGEETSPYE